MQEWTFYKNRCHPGVANGAVFLKGRQGRRTWASELSVWERYERRSNIRGERTRGEALERGACIHTYTCTCTCVCTRLKKFTQRVYTPRRHSRTRLRAWRTKAPGKRKDVVKKTTGERAGDAARSSSHRRYYTRYDGKLALTVSAVDFRLAPVGSPAFGFESGAVSVPWEMQPQRRAVLR